MSHDAFLSYACNDDKGEGDISALRLALERFLGAHLGRPATIYQDKDGLRVGQVWHDELESALRCPCLIPVVTPGYLNSDYCVKELIDFAALEAGKQQIDRIMPLYYIEVGAIEHRLGRPSQLGNQHNSEKQVRAIDILTQRQMEDIRWFRTSSPSEIIKVREARAVLDRVARELATRTLSARRTAPTMVVDREGAGLHSISAAIRRAGPGERILVKGSADPVKNPAVYRESLIIDKPLEIIGQPGVTLVGIDGPAIACTGALVRIAKLNVTAEGFNGVIISGGYCVLQELEISGTRYSAVLIRDGAESLIIGCSLHHAEHCGVHAQLDSKCTVVNSTIRENGTGGLFYSQGAEGLAEGNLIERNNYNGIYITARANPSIRRNRIRFHRYAGVLVYQQGDMSDYSRGRGIIEDNDITDGDQFGIEIKEGGDPCVRRNTIKANACGGIWTHEGGSGTIYDNQILENHGAGIKNEGGQPRIGRNVFSGNGGKPVEDHGGAIFDEQASCGD